MAIRASREVVIDASREDIMEALADVAAFPSWSPVHKRAEVVDTYGDGRPRHVKVTVRVVGITDKELLEFHWGPDWLVWDAQKTFHQHAQHVEFNLSPEIDRTRVRFDVTVEPSTPVLHLLVKRAERVIMEAGTEGLRRWVMRERPTVS
jgi:uncharacterized protein YndB with AHSA1/START domain